MARLVRNILAVLLLAAFTLPAVGYAVGMARGAAVSKSENRRLAGFPSWRAGDSFRGYTSRIDDHLKDRFGGRTLLIDVAREVRDNLGEDPPLVVRGKDDWLFLGQTGYREEYEGRGRWDDAQVGSWAEDLSAADSYFESRGIPFIAAIAPDKARIYPEHLPEDWTRGERRFAAAVLDATERDVTRDLEPAILAAKAAGEQAYLRRDTHWAPSGSLAALNVLLDALGREPGEGGPVGQRTRSELGDLERMSGSDAPSEPPYAGRALPSRAGYAPRFPERDADGVPVRRALATKIITDGVDDADGTLVIVGDSFADFMMPQIMPHFARVVKIHHGAGEYTVGTDEVVAYSPDAVLFLVVERDAARKERPLLIGPTLDADGASLPLPQVTE